MTSPDHPAANPQRVRPYAMTGGRTRPTHDTLEIETLVSTASSVDLTPKLTVEQRAIAVLCHDLLSIAEVSAKLHLPLGVVRVLVGDMATSAWSWSTGRPTLATVPTWSCWSGCCTGSTASNEHSGLSEPPVLSAHSSRVGSGRVQLCALLPPDSQGQPPSATGGDIVRKIAGESGVWWAREELNLRPLPCQQIAGNRCTKRRLCRSALTVDAEVKCSLVVQLSALFAPAASAVAAQIFRLFMRSSVGHRHADQAASQRRR